MQERRASVGFVGTGNIGLPMCARLVEGGHRVIAYDSSEAALSGAVAAGATPAAGVIPLAEQCAVAFTCLPSPSTVAEVVEGLLDAGPRGLVVVDLSTNEPDVARSLAARAAQIDKGFLDSPVAGGVPRARAGTLTLMVGGDAADLGRVRSLLDLLGSTIVHVGPSGAGSVAKLLNNYLAFCNLAAATEAFLTAQRSGLDPASFLSVLEVSSGASASLERFRRKVLKGDFSAEFTIDLSLKDIALALATGERAGVPMPFASTVAVQLQQARAAGYGDLDLSGVVRVLEDITGERIRER